MKKFNYQAVSFAAIFLMFFVLEDTGCWAFTGPCSIQGRFHHLGLRYSSSTSKATNLRLGDNDGYDDDDDDDDYGFDEDTVRNPSSEIARIKEKIEVAKEEGDMDTVMTLVGTLLALGGGYDSES